VQATERFVDEGYGRGRRVDEEDVVVAVHCSVEGSELRRLNVCAIAGLEVGGLYLRLENTPTAYMPVQAYNVARNARKQSVEKIRAAFVFLE